MLERYERVTFDRHLVREPFGKPVADLVHPAHPLMAAVLDVVLHEKKPTLQAGTVLVDPLDPGTKPRLLFMIEHVVQQGTTTKRVASRRMHFVEIDEAGKAQDAGSAPYLNYYAPAEAELAMVAGVLKASWLQQDLRQLAMHWATQYVAGDHLTDVRAAREHEVQKTLEAVHARLTKEITYWSIRKSELDAEVKAGKQPKLQPDNARRRAEELTARLKYRTEELESMLHLSSSPPEVVGCALVLPQGLVDDALFAAGETPKRVQSDWKTSDPEVRRQVELIAMKAVMDAEVALGHTVKDVSAEKCGWDVHAVTADGEDRFIEVKGRVHDAETITVTTNEVLMGMNKGDRFFLAFVLVNGGTTDGPHYIRAPFSKEPDVGAASVNYELKKLRAVAKTAADA